MNMHVGARESRAHSRAVFVQVSPELIAQLAAVVEAGIDLLDQIGGDPDDEGEPLEDTGDIEPEGDEDEPELGSPDALQPTNQEQWAAGCLDAREEECEGEAEQCDDEGDQEWDSTLTFPRTEGGLAFTHRLPVAGPQALAVRNMFDPRLACRPERRTGWNRGIPRFPHEPADATAFDVWAGRRDVGGFLAKHRRPPPRRRRRAA